MSPELEREAERPSLTRFQRAERRRQRILEAAGHHFASNGYAKTTVDEIASAAGVSKALVYSHFDSKEALLDHVLSSTLEQWAEATQREIAARPHDTGQAIATMHRASVAFARGNPFLRMILSQDARLLMTGRHEIQAAMQRWRESLVSRLRAGVEAGELDRDLDVERTADVIRILHVAILGRLADPRGTIEVEDDAVTTAAAEFMLRGIGARVSGAGRRAP